MAALAAAAIYDSRTTMEQSYLGTIKTLLREAIACIVISVFTSYPITNAKRCPMLHSPHTFQLHCYRQRIKVLDVPCTPWHSNETRSGGVVEEASKATTTLHTPPLTRNITQCSIQHVDQQRHHSQQ